MAKNKYYPPRGFAGRLYDAWIASGMSQAEIGRRIGFERKSINAWVNGDGVPNVLALARLCQLFKVSADYLLFGKEDKSGGQKRDSYAAEASASGNQSRRGY